MSHPRRSAWLAWQVQIEIARCISEAVANSGKKRSKTLDGYQGHEYHYTQDDCAVMIEWRREVWEEANRLRLIMTS